MAHSRCHVWSTSLVCRATESQLSSLSLAEEVELMAFDAIRTQYAH